MSLFLQLWLWWGVMLPACVVNAYESTFVLIDYFFLECTYSGDYVKFVSSLCHLLSFLFVYFYFLF